MLKPKLAKGPAEVMRALLSDDPDQVKEAAAFQRESFRAAFGCYPEQCQVVAVEDMTVEEVRALGGHPDRPGAR